ncbi:MAG TPA: hypothetical protein VGI29_07610 [Candidatus Binataceae bacterium]|jgi:hypothetical protein
MRSLLRALAIVIALCCMASCQAAIQAQQEQKAVALKRDTTFDRERILISTGDLSNPHEKLGDLSYSEPLNSESIDSTHINEKLRQMAIDKWGNQVDALIFLKSGPSADATMITASCVAVRVIGDCDFCRHNTTMPTN